MHRLALTFTLVAIFSTGIDGKSDLSTNDARVRAVQLIRKGKNGRLEIVEEAMKKLKEWNDKDHYVLSSVGTFHSGKSFLMNQLMQKTSGFATGSGVDPTTKGIWMWESPVEIGSSRKSTILLDTEGLSASGNGPDYDAKIFAVASLISNHLVYNSVRVIDESSMEYLELLARRARLFQVSASHSKAADGPTTMNLFQFPSLTWVVQNFFQNLENETPNQWLERMLVQQVETTEDGDVEVSGLKDIFQRRFCRTLFLPASTKEELQNLDQLDQKALTSEFNDDIANLIEHLGNELGAEDLVNRQYLDEAEATSQKILAAESVEGRHPRKGREIEKYLRMLVEAANGNHLDKMPSRWNLYLKQQMEQSLGLALGTFTSQMEQVLSQDEPVPHTDFEMKLEQITLDCLHQFRASLFYMNNDAITNTLAKLDNGLKDSKTQLSSTHEKKLQTFFNEKKDKTVRVMEVFISSLSLPMKSRDLRERMNEKKKELEENYRVYRQDYNKESLEGAEGFLENALQVK